MIPIIDMNDPIQAQAKRGQELYDLMAKCKKTGLWDGLVRNGYVLPKQRAVVANFSSDPEVQDQLFLQMQAGKLKIPA